MKNVAVIGHFGVNHIFLDGQTVKTKIITKELVEHFGEDEVIKVDTHGTKIVSVLKAPFQAIKALIKSKNVIILPAQNGVRIFVPLIVFFKRFFKNRKLHYVVIGGWLPKFLQDKPKLKKKLKKFDCIYVETNTMKAALDSQGFGNVVVMPNCKDLKILDVSELVYPNGISYRLCTFSRVMKEKGIEVAVNAVRKINEKAGHTVYSLDIYGQIDKGQVEWFENLKKDFPDYISYKGVVEADKSVGVLQSYFVLLFPTDFFTEGIPGTIIDAYAAGIPVIASKWESFDDIVDNGITGFGYEFNNSDAFINLLSQIANNPSMVFDIKTNCIERAKRYIPRTALKILIDNTEKNYCNKDD